MNYLVTLINNYRAVTRHSPHHSPATKVRGLGKVIVNVALVYKIIPHFKVVFPTFQHFKSNKIRFIHFVLFMNYVILNQE